MNTLMIITLAAAIPVYALLWNNQPARTQRGKTTVIEAALTFLFNPSWLTRIAALVTHWVASNIPTNWQAAKIHAHRPPKI